MCNDKVFIMPRIVKPLTDSEIKKANPRDKEYFLYDGNNLRLKVLPTGTKRFIFNYKRPSTCKKTNLTIGTYGAITLHSARSTCQDYNKLLSQGLDPQIEINSVKHRQQDTLLLIAKRWRERNVNSVLEETMAQNWKRLENHLFPKLGHYPIVSIKPMDIVNCFEPIVDKGQMHNITRLCSSLNQIVDFAIILGFIQLNPFIRIRSSFPAEKVQHHPTIPPDELPELLHMVDNCSANLQAKLMFYWQLMTFSRPKETASARWDQLDMNKSYWKFLPEDTKQKKEHTVLLSKQCIEILKQIKAIAPKSMYIFPHISNPKKHASSQSINQLLKRNGYKGRLVAHGLRTLVSTILNEEGYNSDYIEKALAHTDKNSIRKIYNRAEYLSQRKKMMQWFSDLVESQRRVKLK